MTSLFLFPPHKDITNSALFLILLKETEQNFIVRISFIQLPPLKEKYIFGIKSYSTTEIDNDMDFLHLWLSI